MFYTTFSHYKKKKDPSHSIRWIAQTGPIKEGLKSDYFAELLHLSKDQPNSIAPEEAQKILQNHPLIKEVKVRLLNFNILYIDYIMRQPRFFLFDFSNIVMDEMGYLMPFKPFFTPKRLPTLFLGLKSISWYEPVQEEKVHLALDLTHCLKGIARTFQIDLSQIEAETLGKKEIILTIDNENGSYHYLRLSLKRYMQEILHYRSLRGGLVTKNVVIDLRLPNLAFIKIC